MIDHDRLARELADTRTRVVTLERRVAVLERALSARTTEADVPLAAGSGHDLIRRYRALFPRAMKSTVVRLLECGTCPDGAAPILTALCLVYGSGGPNRATVYRALSQQSHPETT